MNHDRFAEWDGAYVLGSLSSADRAEYEEHLATCDACRAAIAEIAPVSGLLSRVSRERAESLGAPEAADPDARARFVAEGTHRSRRGRRSLARRRRIPWIAAGAAAVVAIGAAVAIPMLTDEGGTGETIAFERLVDAPIDASVELTQVSWGTRIDMSCEYGENPTAPDDGLAYALVVVSDEGVESELSSWRAYPDTTARLTAGTALDADEIGAFEIRATPDGPALLRADMDSE